MSQSITLEDVPGLYKTHQIPSKNIAKKTRVTQVYGSMLGKDAIDMLDKIEEEEAAKEKAKRKVNKKERSYERRLFQLQESVCLWCYSMQSKEVQRVLRLS